MFLYVPNIYPNVDKKNIEEQKRKAKNLFCNNFFLL